MQRISPFLWFDDNAEEAANFYTSVFKDAKINKITRYPEEPAKQIGREPGSVMTVEFTLDGVEFVALNPESVRGEPGVCSWLKDKYGLSWQVQPRLLIELLGDPDKAKAERVMNAMMKMTKIDIAALEEAAAGSWPLKRAASAPYWPCTVPGGNQRPRGNRDRKQRPASCL
jgi:predicted 3-demethylubiquinone-9 3-methyltransferase (glyoxalase superfamily)